MKALNDLDDTDMADCVFRTIQANWSKCRASEQKDRSRENWRWCEIQPQIARNNHSPEVTLERAIAASCIHAERSDWANQIPVASGLIPGPSGGRRAIDLVQKRGDGHFEFIELKIASDTPLYAAIEIIGYACIWLLTRIDPPSRPSALLDAEHIDLSVLAPAAYYAPFKLDQLEAALDRSVAALAKAHKVSMTFRFDVLDNRLVRIPFPDNDALMSLLMKRPPLHWGAGK